MKYIKFKTKLDQILAWAGMIILAPVFLAIIIAIKLEDGITAPVFFSQKRVGINKTYFELYKFRSMSLDTPHDMPTHLLENPEQYITKTGRFLRKTSLDELPQMWNIARGDMAVIGPRPALWNQFDLIEERDKYGANDIKPGLTGWAQINGRDELEIPEKARLDGYYVEHMGPVMDLRCFFGTIFSVLKSDGVVEGGTGAMATAKKEGKRVIIVANVAKEHVLKFHIPTIKMLKRNGWYVAVACAGNEKVPYCDIQYRMKHKRNPLSISTIKGIFQLREILKKENYDVLHCHTATGGVVGRLATLGLKERPYVMYTVHGFHFYKGSSVKNWIVSFPMEWILSFLTDRLIVINQEDYDIAINSRMGMKDIKILNGMGIEEKKFAVEIEEDKREDLRKELDISDDEVVFTYVAEILKNKNQEVLIRALKKVRNKTGKGILVLVGPEHDNGKYRKLTKELGVEKYVRFTGWRNDIGVIFSVTDIAVASSLREGLGLNLVEAQFSGVPVIASDNRGHREVISNGVNGYLVSAKNVNAYADKMIELMKDEDKRTLFVKNGKRMSQKFSLESSVQSLEEYYNSIERK